MSTQVQTIVSDGLSSNNAAQEHLALFAAIFANKLQPKRFAVEFDERMEYWNIIDNESGHADSTELTRAAADTVCDRLNNTEGWHLTHKGYDIDSVLCDEPTSESADQAYHNRSWK